MMTAAVWQKINVRRINTRWHPAGRFLIHTLTSGWFWFGVLLSWVVF